MTDGNNLREEAYRLSEKMLEMQFAAALSADQRAMSAAGITAAAAAILAGLASASAIPFAMLSGAMFLVVGAMFAWRAAMPVSFYAPGSSYENFKEDIEGEVHYLRVIAEMGGWNDKHIKSNRAVMSLNSKKMKRMYWLTAIGLAVAIAPQMYANFI